MTEDAKGKVQDDEPQDEQKFLDVMMPARLAFYARIRDLDENAFREEVLTEPLNDFATIALWYGHAVTNYAMSPATPAHRARRPRMIAIARILKATLFAHVGDHDDIIKELEDVAGRHLRKRRLDPGADSREAMAELCGGNVKDEMLQGVNMLLAECSTEATKRSLEKLAFDIASSFLANYGTSIVDGLPPEVPLRDSQTYRRTADAIKKILRPIDADKWPDDDLDTAEKVIRAVLYELGHKGARGFFDYRGKRVKPQMRTAK